MTTAPGFHAENYHAVRQAILDAPAFNWWQPLQPMPSDEGCIACFCLRVEGVTGKAMGDPEDIRRVLGCSVDEAAQLFAPRCALFRFGVDSDRTNRESAIAALDSLAKRYGVTPESAPAPAQVQQDELVTTCGLTSAGTVNPNALTSATETVAAETQQSAAGDAERKGVRSVDHSEPSSPFSPNERAFVAALKADADQFAAEVRKELAR